MQDVKREDKEVYGVHTTIHHAMLPSSFAGKLVPDEATPTARNYHRIEGSVPQECLVAEPVESRPLALEAVGEHLKGAANANVSPTQVKNYMSYMIEKFKDEEKYRADET